MTDNSDDAWDALCVDPHADALAEGRRRGASDGRAAGWREGHATGRTTAAEHGMELGWVRGVVTELRRQNAVWKDERLQKSTDSLLRALDGFPSPEDVFRGQQQRARDPLREEDPNDTGDAEELPNGEDGSSSELDVAGKLQRIQARFKLLMVQLGLPHFSLKRTMDQAAAYSDSATTPASTEQQLPANQPNPEPSDW